MARGGVPGWLPERLKQARVGAGLSRDELARRVGVSLGMIRRYELGLASPTAETLGRIAAALGARPVDYLDSDVKGLAALRASQGLSQEEVVARAGVPELTVAVYSSWETGLVRRIRTSYVIAIAAVLKVEAEDVAEAHAHDVRRRQERNAARGLDAEQG